MYINVHTFIYVYKCRKIVKIVTRCKDRKHAHLGNEDHAFY